MQTQTQYSDELERQYDGPIPAHLKQYRDSGAFPGSNPPSMKDVQRFVDALREALKYHTLAGEQLPDGMFNLVAVGLEYQNLGAGGYWELSLHSPILAGDTGLTCVSFTGTLDVVWEAGKAAWCASFHAAATRLIAAQLEAA